MTSKKRPPTLHELREAERGYALVAAEAEKLRERRNLLILKALATGLTHAQVAQATGLTRGRIGQIAQASDDSD